MQNLHAFEYQIDTMTLEKKTVKERILDPPSYYKLQTLYRYVTGRELQNAHRSSNDVDATIAIIQHEVFWKERATNTRVINRDKLVGVSEIVAEDNDNDSDTEHESDLEDDVVHSEEEEEVTTRDKNDCMIGWRQDTPYHGVGVKQRFLSVISRIDTRLVKGMSNVGLQVSPNSFNSPIKAWRHIFTDALLNKIVIYTNDYGGENCSHWQSITKYDLTDFFSILFITSIQKRKDRSHHWFSEDKLLENHIVKRVMSGNKFHRLLRYLHVCDMYAQPNTNDPYYGPTYKIKEMSQYMERRYKTCFVPGMELSLDETLIRSFGRIKFKVRIITKSERHGIKVYVITDALTAYVLKVIFYTGKYTYHRLPDNEDVKKTVRVVKELCSDFRGSHRIIYIDRFYTSISLMNALDEMKLYVTGTVMKNRIPKELVMKRASRQYKDMGRGECNIHTYEYKTPDDERITYGLVCWKDRDLVYALTNNCDTTKREKCYRRTSLGRICIDRPTVIGEYNEHMGGVDLADMRRLHCNSTIMGIHRWWLNLFFYMLDVGTSNSLVLYRESGGMDTNIVEFKKKLVLNFVGTRIEDIERPIVEHQLVRMCDNSRLGCAYCSLFCFDKRTRYKCQSCDVPLCSVGSGRSEFDCFSLEHENEQIRTAVIRRYDGMRTKANKKKRLIL